MLSKIKPRYLQVSVGCKIRSSKELRFKEEGLKFVDLEK